MGPTRGWYSALGNRYLWQGREYSWSTGLYSFRARWYDPLTGRWLSPDPIGINGGLNLYVAFNNNPVNNRDPDGELAFTAAVVSAAVSGAALYYGLTKLWEHTQEIRRLPDLDADDPCQEVCRARRDTLRGLEEIRDFTKDQAYQQYVVGPLLDCGTGFLGALESVPAGGPRRLTGRPGYVRHRGYVRSDTGTYVPPHYQRPPGSTLAPPNNHLYPR